MSGSGKESTLVRVRIRLCYCLKCNYTCCVWIFPNQATPHSFPDLNTVQPWKTLTLITFESQIWMVNSRNGCSYRKEKGMLQKFWRTQILLYKWYKRWTNLHHVHWKVTKINFSFAGYKVNFYRTVWLFFKYIYFCFLPPLTKLSTFWLWTAHVSVNHFRFFKSPWFRILLWLMKISFMLTNRLIFYLAANIFLVCSLQSWVSLAERHWEAVICLIIDLHNQKSSSVDWHSTNSSDMFCLTETEEKKWL